MSLNGLDSPEVQAAYQSVIAEAAGWFLLKYVSRDGVELLARGRNGVSEARNAITAYTESSPLYGLLIYRRRRTLIKYIPEGTSRLLQARTSVHFQDVLERYSPYETLLEITSGDALNDTALAKTFQLHTASPSPSVGRLDEITEDGEDAGADLGSLASANASTSSLSAAQRYKASRRMEHLSRRAERGERASSSLQVGGEQLSLSRHSTPPASPLNPAHAQYLGRENSGQASTTSKEQDLDITSSVAVAEAEQSAAPSSTGDLLDSAAERLADTQVALEASGAQPTLEAPTSEKPAQEEPDALPPPTPEPLPRKDAEAPQPDHPAASETSASIRGVSMDEDPYDLSKYDKYFKPKVKLGPRPVTSAERASVARVSTVPANFKHARKQDPSRLESQGRDSRTPPAATAAQSEPTFHLPPPIPALAEYSPRPYSRGSVKSLPSHRSSAMTPDRLRLQKAVELRKRQLRKSQEQSSFVPPIDEDPPEMPKLQTQTPPQPLPTLKSDKREQHIDAETEQSNTDDESQPLSSKADSGIEIRYDTPAYDDLDEQGPSLYEELATTPSVSSISQGASDTQPVSAEIELPGQDTHSETPEDELSLTDSYTPTERTMVQQQVSDAAPAIPTIELAEASRPTTAESQADAGADLVRVPSSETLRSVDTAAGSAQEALSRPESPDLSKRRRGMMEPLHIEVSSGNPVDISSGIPDEFMSDDDFLEELHDATVEEARPIVVGSPLSPSHSFPKHQPSMEDSSALKAISITRRPSIPLSRQDSENDCLSPNPGPAVVSTLPTEKSDPAWIPPRKVSSGISARIQALNEMSSREASIPGHSASSRPLTPETSPNTFLLRDPKARGPRKAHSPAARPVSFRRLSKNNGANFTSAITPAMENVPTLSVQHDPMTISNSVSVTARIVRPKMNSDQEQFFPSELTINHVRDQASRSNVDLAPIDIAAAQESNTSSPALSPERTLHSASRFGRRRKLPTPETPEMDDFPPPPSQSMSALSISDENATTKNGTRTSRFFKRVSGLSGPKRRSSAQSVTSAASVVSHESESRSKAANRMSMATHRSDTPPAVVVGDLNVQFPDSLLWKRRIVTINDNGQLQFAIAHAMEIHKGVALRQFALQEFGAPYAPDLDRQELANSVVLDLLDGSTLQLACEDPMTQRQVLHLLKSYWKSWAVV